MKSVSISGSPRVNVGKKDAKAIRLKKMYLVYYTEAKNNFFSLHLKTVLKKLYIHRKYVRLKFN